MKFATRFPYQQRSQRHHAQFPTPRLSLSRLPPQPLDLPRRFSHTTRRTQPNAGHNKQSLLLPNSSFVITLRSVRNNTIVPKYARPTFGELPTTSRSAITVANQGTFIAGAPTVKLDCLDSHPTLFGPNSEKDRSPFLTTSPSVELPHHSADRVRRPQLPKVRPAAALLEGHLPGGLQRHRGETR